MTGSGCSTRCLVVTSMSDIRPRRPIRLFAPAKVNLGLEILRRRVDGYHDVVTILQTVSLFDEITLSPSERFEFDGDGGVPRVEDLAFRAVQLANEELGLSLKARVNVRKRIPLAAGLGGGSSDAGTLLAAICQLGHVDETVCRQLAARLGSDVPFFVQGGTAIATGTGTTLDQLPSPERIWLVIVTPDVRRPNKTAGLYGSLRTEDFTDGSATRAVATRIRTATSIDFGTLRNAFSRAIYTDKRIASARDIMEHVGAQHILPCGAGPSLFATLPTFEHARTMARRLRDAGLTTRLCTNVASGINQGRISSGRE